MRWLLLLATLVFLASCGDVPPVRGTAAEASAAAAGRSEIALRESDGSAIAAAKSKAKAAELARLATEEPTAARIAAAADARVEAAAWAAVAEATHKIAEEAKADAAKHVEAARAERLAEAKADEDRHWLAICRWVGLGGVVAGALIGGVLAYFVTAKVGILTGSLIAGTGFLATAFGATVTWLPIAVLVVVVAGLAIWAWSHRGALAVVRAASLTIDAEAGQTLQTTASEAKTLLGKTIDASGLRGRLSKIRAKWYAPSGHA